MYKSTYLSSKRARAIIVTNLKMMLILAAIKRSDGSSFASTALHDTHSSAQAHTTATASTASGRATLAAFKSALCKGLILLASWVTDGLIDGKNCAGSLARSCQNIQAHNFWLPYEFLIHVVDLTFEYVDSLPNAILLSVHLSESVQDVR